MLTFDKLTFPGSEGRVWFRLDGASYVVSAMEMPEGTRLEFDGQSTVVGEIGYAQLELALDISWVAELPLDALVETSARWGPEEKKLSIWVPGREVTSLSVPQLERASWLRVLFLSAESTEGLRFGPNDTAVHGKAQRTVLYLNGEPLSLGPGKQLKDVDWIVLQDDQAPPEEETWCEYSTVDGTRVPVKLQREVQALAIIERRTAKKLASRRFVGPLECAKSELARKRPGFVEAASSLPQRSLVDTKAVATWIEGQRRR